MPLWAPVAGYDYFIGDQPEGLLDEQNLVRSSHGNRLLPEDVFTRTGWDRKEQERSACPPARERQQASSVYGVCR